MISFFQVGRLTPHLLKDENLYDYTRRTANSSHCFLSSPIPKLSTKVS